MAANRGKKFMKMIYLRNKNKNLNYLIYGQNEVWRESLFMFYLSV